MKIQLLATGCGKLLAPIIAILLLTQTGWTAPKYKVLHAFGAGNDGGGLWTSVIFDKKGSLFGATSGGGMHGYGIIFKLTPRTNGRWSETILHSFANGDPDGSEPNGGLIQDARGNWYGTTSRDGTHHGGTAFQLTHELDGWTVKVIYAFGDHSGDGGEPTAGLVMDKSGNLYGTNPKGGARNGNGGTAFELTPGGDGWHEAVLHRFIENGDGGGAYAGVILDSAGNLYGTTRGGGAYGVGTVYELRRTSGGWREAILHSFDNNGKDGYTPGWGTLVMDASGSLFGTTEVGGHTSFGGGTVFQLTKLADGSWKEAILYNFVNGSTGWGPGAGVVMDKSSNLYGTTIYGGSGCGVVYKLAPAPTGKWTYTVLHTFTGNDGCQPDANLILDDKGNLYGTTATGGAYGGGVVFELTP